MQVSELSASTATGDATALNDIGVASNSTAMQSGLLGADLPDARNAQAAGQSSANRHSEADGVAKGGSYSESTDLGSIPNLDRLLGLTGPAPSGETPAGLVTGLKKWEGIVEEVEGGMFSAELTPLGHGGPTLIANFAVGHLARDGESVSPGDMFYLTTRTVRDGLVSKQTSNLRRRRLGRWTEEELEAARARARELASSLDGDVS